MAVYSESSTMRIWLEYIKENKPIQCFIALLLVCFITIFIICISPNTNNDFSIIEKNMHSIKKSIKNISNTLTQSKFKDDLTNFLYNDYNYKNNTNVTYNHDHENAQKIF